MERVPSDNQDQMMLRKLLADRFQLKVHRVQKIFPVYALTIESDPPKLSRSDPSANSYGHIITKEGADGQMLVQFIHNTMREFDDVLMNFIKDRQIVDETGLTGSFDFTISIPTSAVQGGQTNDENDTATAFLRAVQPIGFRLMPKNAPLEIIVIDHLKPSAN